MSGQVNNPGGFTHPDDILGKIVSFNGLFRKIFGELQDDIVYDQRAEYDKRMLREVYQLKDVNDIFPKLLKRRQFMRTLETVFRFFRQDPGLLPK